MLDFKGDMDSLKGCFEAVSSIGPPYIAFFTLLFVGDCYLWSSAELDELSESEEEGSSSELPLDTYLLLFGTAVLSSVLDTLRGEGLELDF